MNDYMMTGNTRTLAQAHSPGASADSQVVISDSLNPLASMNIPTPAPVLPGFVDIGAGVSPLVRSSETTFISHLGRAV